MDGALQRYVAEFGGKLAYGDYRRQGRALRLVGLCLLPAGIALGVGGWLAGSEAAYGGIGPAIAGAIQIAMGTFMARSPVSASITKLTPEAARAVRSVTGETQAWANWSTYRSDGSRRVPIRLTGGVREWMEACAAHALRIDGALSTAVGRPSLERRRAALANAVHSAMSEAFHHACIAAERPEASTTALGRIIETEAKLAEMAERIEAMVRSATLEDRIAGHSPLDDALDGLRNEAAAERELA